MRDALHLALIAALFAIPGIIQGFAIMIPVWISQAKRRRAGR
jgi:hypothetical protein